jgi:hypothetical protein
MKRIHYCLALFLITAIFSGCDFTTLYPIFTVKDIRFREQLLGFWKISNKENIEEYLEIEKISPSSLTSFPESLQKISGQGYLVTRRDIKLTIISRHIAFLARIGSYTYLDNYPLETEEEKGYFNFYKNHYVKMHSIYRIDMTNNDKFELREFDSDFIENLIDTKKIRIRHSTQPLLTNIYIITSPTMELQSYLIKYAGNPKAYAKESITEYVKLH